MNPKLTLCSKQCFMESKQLAASDEKIGCGKSGVLRLHGNGLLGVNNVFETAETCGSRFSIETHVLCISCSVYAKELIEAMGNYQSRDSQICKVEIEQFNPYADISDETEKLNAQQSATADALEGASVIDISTIEEGSSQKTFYELGAEFLRENKVALAGLVTLALAGGVIHQVKKWSASSSEAKAVPSSEPPFCSEKPTKEARESCVKSSLNNFYKESLAEKDAVIGYPEATDYHAEDIKKFLEFSLNNCGNWEESTNYPLTTFKYEKKVMEYFTELFGTNLKESWGYVTNGGTDGNLWGCYLAREKFGDSSVLFYTNSAHYSVSKIVRMLKLKACEIKSQANGEMNYDDFKTKLESYKGNSAQNNSAALINPIVFNTIGTTLTGAVDNITEVQIILNSLGYTKEKYHIHADAALSGLILPYVSSPQAFKFSDGVDSLSVSGHKMLGSPIPCGVAIAKRYLVNNIAQTVDYISANDLTIAGSRNGLTPLHLWQEINRSSHSEKIERVKECLSVAEGLVRELKNAGINAWRHNNSVTVVFPSPAESIWRKHKLASANGVTHIIVAGYNKGVKNFLESAVKDIINHHQSEILKTTSLSPEMINKTIKVAKGDINEFLDVVRGRGVNDSDINQGEEWMNIARSDV